MENKDNLYTIGEISKITGLTRAMLMYYEDKDIIVPVMRDSENNYRYYNEQQLEELLLLKELKRVGFSIEQLTTIVKKRDLAYFKTELGKKIKLNSEMIIGAVQEINHYNELYYRMMDAISILADTNVKYQEKQSIESPDFSFFSHDEKPIVSISYYGLFNYRKLHMEKVAYLYNIIEDYQLHTTGPVNVIFHDCIETSYSDTEGEIEIFIPLSQNNPQCPFVRMLPETQYIFSVLKGDYSCLEKEYQRLFEFAEQMNIRYEKTSVEEYVVGPTMTFDSKNYLTRIYIPIINNKLR